ncbi:protein kinase family protein with PASTA domain [Desulfosporosinus orientis DSM 765]|uniref:non-specific serine/threonine protein kinase n=1 Tax=Desulfosporosinus orientis (strain ATCC 19365 / DSM 765 / NCIMB 8382 / VKM B-1628 / Singapore I) TaxID=768706 RepID=G7WG36_DESOD|nr:Stk1 family PASTA domain-containing Ser/Thr kinase [Desulfosporosinus orientis]AET70130.1 protein kinase family protein with PASTA domain [Desulfosporosinus orientis DSM 765]
MSKIFGGRYEVLERIGAGGMAIVYKAKDLLLNRVVTIKVLREQFVTDEDFIRRFRREAQSAASLSHPNIVSIYDVGKDGDTEYIVMEYVEGRNLKEIIREYAPLSTDQAINLARQITGAIQNAHENHIIHRDIKPHNILVTAEGNVKVTDFGIARAVSSATVTHTGDIVGSVHYLSPEQAKGIQSNERSDIYSLGIVLYELLTGKVPYDGETPIAIALKHLQQDPEPPSRLNPRISKDFEAVIMRAISKSPEQRYSSAKELLEDLNNIQTGRPISWSGIFPADDLEKTQTHIGIVRAVAPVDIKEPSPPKKVNKSRRLWIVGGLVLLLVLIGGGLLWNFIFVGTTTVPDLAGKTVPVAEDFIKSAQLTFNPDTDVTTQFSDDVDKDRIISQDPEAGSKVKVGRTVKIVVGKGVDIGQFPDVKTGHMAKDNAIFLIQTAGFTGDINIVERMSPDVPKNAVIDQDPLPKATWPKNGNITLIVSSGPELTTINMPNVIGKPSAEAQRILEDEYKLVLKVQSADSNMFPKDSVISTTPNPGESVKQGSEVTMVVSRGPGPIAQGIMDHESIYRVLIAEALAVIPAKG